MAIADEVITPAPLLQQATQRRVRIPDYLNLWWKSKYADWELPDINITHLVTRFVGKFDVPAWTRSIELLLAKHPILNARVEVDGDSAEITLESTPSNLLTILEMPVSQGADPQNSLKELVASLVWHPFGRKGERLFRAFMIRVSERECVVGIVVHHGIADGWSMAIIGRELLVEYAASITGRQRVPPVPGLQYLDYIEWLNNWLNGTDAQLQKQYWMRQMMNAQSMRLPAEDNVDHDIMADWAKESFAIEPELVRAVCKRAGQTRATPFLLTLTAKIAALAVITGSCDVLVVIVAEQRSHRLRNAVGIFVNFLPIRAAVSWNESFDELAARVRAIYVEACANQTYPYSLINPHEDVFPTFRFRRIVGENEPAELPSRGFQFFELPPPPPTRTPAKGVGHELFILHTDNAMSGRVRYLSTLHKRQTVTRFAHVFCAALALGAYDSAKPLGALLEN